MEEENNYIFISSYDDKVRYINDVIDGKEHRCPIFMGNDVNSKSIFSRMIENGDIDETKVRLFLSQRITL
jgi:hypothetical protein